MTGVFVLLGIGSNINRETNIKNALFDLKNAFGEIKISPVYESEAAFFRGAPFFNLVVCLHTLLDIPSLFSTLREIEHKHGRQRTKEKYTPTTLDIDILTYGDFCCVEASIILPRKELTVQPYVLRPLAELCPNTIHPLLKKSYQQLWCEHEHYKNDGLKLIVLNQ